MARSRDREEFCHIAGQEGLALHTARELMRLAATHGRLQEEACSVAMSEEREAAHGRKEERTESKIRSLLPEGWGVVFSGDPRGATVKLTCPSGRTNDWGQTGICVPQ